LMRKVVFLLLLCMPCCWCTADDTKIDYMSLRSQSVNMRVGPGKQYPIIWHYNVIKLPVLALAHFNDWVKIRDHEGTEGWVHKNFLSPKRTVITLPKVTMMYKAPSADSPIIAKLEKNVICETISAKDSWVRVGVNGLKGWVNLRSLWGCCGK
jgi:SH3-like domain-containing protein